MSEPSAPLATQDARGGFGSRLGFILAASGSAVGLGNLWKFPYAAYANGGGGGNEQGAGSFVLIYLLAVLLVGLPIMLAEILIGRRTRRNPVGAFKALSPGTPWKLVGALGVFTGFLLLSYYNVVAGWTVEYAVKSVGGEFSARTSEVGDSDLRDRLWSDFRATPDSLAQLPAPPAPTSALLTPAAAWAQFAAAHPAAYAELEAELRAELWQAFILDPDFAALSATLRKEILPGKLFNEFLASPLRQVGWALFFMCLSVGVVIAGVARGIERWTKILMPLLFILLIVLLVRMLTLEGAGPALAFLFVPRAGQLCSASLLAALGQAFFSLSLGMGAIITYGSYLTRRTNIAAAACAVTLMDTMIAIIAAIIIFAAIFSYGLVMQDGGAGNLFTAIPVIFMKIPGGTYLCVVFYVLIMFAALTSTISLLETVVSYFIDERGWSRRKATTAVGAAVFAVGLPSALSFSVLADVQFFGRSWFEMADYLCSNWFLPLGGLLVALFVGWRMTAKELREELPPAQLPRLPFVLWRALLSYVAPAAVLVVMVGILVGAVQA